MAADEASGEGEPALERLLSALHQRDAQASPAHREDHQVCGDPERGELRVSFCAHPPILIVALTISQLAVFLSYVQEYRLRSPCEPVPRRPRRHPRRTDRLPHLGGGR